ncbi:MAG: hypothetical protein CYPHOPRED_005202 [Cyphobasidiales sp. Tagirdzhanova-0007]|nr:MAG: hypothetical protein CYPHOPRED_005202 [Cyphobasidiales sp. Tagirdzhanova-0007]
MSLVTPCTELFNIQSPIMLAGMNVAAGPDLAAAVTNAGGLGVIGGVNYTPAFLKKQIQELKDSLNDNSAPFGIDLLIPQVGGSARKTNKDYTGGQLNQLIDVIIEEKAALFVCAVGVPPKEVIERLHKAHIPIMNMGGEGGGLLIPELVALCQRYKSPLSGKPVQVIAAGGIYRGSSLAAMLSYGATGVWVEEAGASAAHQKAVISAGFTDTVRTIIYSGRPMRVRKTPYNTDWEENRQKEIKELTSAGKIPVGMTPDNPANRPVLMGKTAAVVHEIQPAKQIVDEMVEEAVRCLQASSSLVRVKAKL